MKVQANESTKALTSSVLLARNATLNVATEGWLAIVLFANIPLLVKFMGKEGFGLFSLAWVVLGYLAFLDIGVSTATTKFTSEHLAKQETTQIGRLVRTALAANSIMGILAGLIALAVAPVLIQHAFRIPAALTSRALSVFIAAAFALPLLLIQGVLRATLSSYQRFDWINLVNGAAMTSQWFVMTFLAWKGFGVVAVVWIAILARLAMVCMYLLLLARLVPDVFSHFSFCWDSLRRLLHFGAWVSISQVISPILVYLDRVLIAAIVSLSAVAIYTVPTEVFNRLGVLPSCLMTTLFPAFSHHGVSGTENGKTSHLFNKTVRYLLFALCPLFAFFLFEARDILTAWMSPEFAAEATLAFKILALGALVNSLARLPYVAVQALGRPDVTAKCHLIELPLYLVLCMILVSRWGIEGAALACAIRLWLDATLMFWAARKFCGLRVRWLSEAGRLLLIEALLVGSLIVVRFLFHDVWGRLLCAATFLGLAYLGMWMYALKAEDKPAILRTFRLAHQEGNH